jgi:hypothetical protein
MPTSITHTNQTKQSWENHHMAKEASDQYTSKMQTTVRQQSDPLLPAR